jgi:hypothetical protein
VLSCGPYPSRYPVAPRRICSFGQGSVASHGKLPRDATLSATGLSKLYGFRGPSLRLERDLLKQNANVPPNVPRSRLEEAERRKIKPIVALARHAAFAALSVDAVSIARM